MDSNDSLGGDDGAEEVRVAVGIRDVVMTLS